MKNVVRITGRGRMRTYITLALELLNEKGFSDLEFAAMGRLVCTSKQMSVYECVWCIGHPSHGCVQERGAVLLILRAALCARAETAACYFRTSWSRRRITEFPPGGGCFWGEWQRTHPCCILEGTHITTCSFLHCRAINMAVLCAEIMKRRVSPANACKQACADTQVCIHATHTLTHTRTHTYPNTHTQTYKHTQTHICTHTHIRTYSYTHARSHTHIWNTHIHTHTHTHTSLRVPTQAHTYTHEPACSGTPSYTHTQHTHTHIHTHTHAYTRSHTDHWPAPNYRAGKPGAH